MKKIFVYYSYSGNGDVVADYLKEKGYEIEKIITKEPLPKIKFLAILVGGYKAMNNHKDKIEEITKDLNDYDEIVIGSPIWNSRLSSPINTLLSQYNFANKKLSFILYCGSGRADKENLLLKGKYSNPKIINLKEPKKNKEELEKIDI